MSMGRSSSLRLIKVSKNWSLGCKNTQQSFYNLSCTEQIFGELSLGFRHYVSIHVLQ